MIGVMVPSVFAIFPDPDIDPEEYLIRYYTEPKYQEWFDTNFPNDSIEDKVGYPYKIVTDEYYVNSLFDFAIKIPANADVLENEKTIGGEKRSLVEFVFKGDDTWASQFVIHYTQRNVDDIYYDDLLNFYSKHVSSSSSYVQQQKIIDQSLKQNDDGMYEVRYNYVQVTAHPDDYYVESLSGKVIENQLSRVILLYPNGDQYTLIFLTPPTVYSSTVKIFNESLDSFYSGKVKKLSSIYPGSGLEKQADAAILVKIFGDEFTFGHSNYQMKDPHIFFADGNLIHRYHEDTTMKLLFNSVNIGIDDQCYVFPDGRSFCTNDDYSLKYFINGKSVSGIRDYVIQDNDRILITFGGETDKEISELYLSELNSIKIKSGDTVIADNAVTDSNTEHTQKITQDEKIAQLEAEKQEQESKIKQLEAEQNGGGCLIATATYGSEMANEVQQLRELRDNQLLQTASGTQFMQYFNDVYYSFSPIIADYERENPYFKEAVKLAITPMISTLSLMENAESESEVLSIGLSVIVLNLGIYLGVPAVLIVGIRKIR